MKRMTEETKKSILAKYAETKEKYPDTLLLWRKGDLYNSYGEDAQAVAKICDLKITHFRCSLERGEQTSFPYMDLDRNLPKLIRAGHRVAICDEID